MRVITERVEVLPLPKMKVKRSPGVHISGIIRALAVEHNYLQSDNFVEDLSLLDRELDMGSLDIVSQLRIHIGLAWEAWYIPLLKDVVDHPGELCLDNIFLSPDGDELCTLMKVDTRRLYYRMKCHEVKATYKSTKTVGDLSDVRKNFMWLLQAKSYCKAENTNLLDLHALHLCGDYKFPIRPVLNIHHIEFEDEEIEDNWDMMKEYRDKRLEITGVQMPLLMGR